MRGGYHVETKEIVERVHSRISLVPLWEIKYFQVMIGSKLDCGHRHRTERAANDRCLQRMMNLAKQRRHEISLRGWRTRRANDRRERPDWPSALNDPGLRRPASVVPHAGGLGAGFD